VFRGDGIELQSVMTSKRPSLGGGISDKSAFYWTRRVINFVNICSAIVQVQNKKRKERKLQIYFRANQSKSINIQMGWKEREKERIIKN
jgi:hypothetical protein